MFDPKVKLCANAEMLVSLDATIELLSSGTLVRSGIATARPIPAMAASEGMQPPPEEVLAPTHRVSSFIFAEGGRCVRRDDRSLQSTHRWRGTELQTPFRYARPRRALLLPRTIPRALAKRKWTPPSTTRATDHAVHQQLQVTATIR